MQFEENKALTALGRRRARGIEKRQRLGTKTSK
jgi:hypothetical protein